MATIWGQMPPMDTTTAMADMTETVFMTVTKDGGTGPANAGGRTHSPDRGAQEWPTAGAVVKRLGVRSRRLLV